MLTKKDILKEESLAAMIDDKNGTQNGETCIQINGWFKKLHWKNIILLSSFHLYFVYACFTFNFLENLKTTAWLLIMIQVSIIGATGGAHRLWSHRAYKAKWPLKIILAIFYASGNLNYSIWDWARDHRVHHKYVDTDTDPHNSTRGFFFSHVGWLMLKRNPELLRRGRQIDMSDILADPIVMFTVKHFSIMSFMFAFLFPMIVPVYGWNETWYRAFASQLIRLILGINFLWTINSMAHTWGSKPYDVHIYPTQNRWVNIMTGGEGWHNYHHVFPWDYKASESIAFMDNTTRFIDFFAKFGWAYDLKQPSKELVKTTAMKKGDGSYSL